MGARPSGGGANRTTREAVFKATWEEIRRTGGYAGLSMSRIAERAGTSKATLYRNWRDITGLLIAVMQRTITTAAPIPNTGSLKDDLRVLALEINNIYEHAEMRTLVGTIVAAGIQGSTDAQKVLFEFFKARNNSAAKGIVDAAIARGELPAGTNGVDIIETLGSLFYYRLWITQEGIDSSVAKLAADVAYAAALAGAYETKSTKPPEAEGRAKG
ncbi:TetR/AcrR family transcriptional regulator [Amycolatopsis nigrescens]|uniref:TetR/AcrR family transcriptional regulator n=1 Tax=Amycolatopsis nigrescens TaxID=381445 RepID=UPI0007C5A685|nr:TetR/AcrR family transcriptional regulator [Amycolatopsis nigrescens]